MNEVAALVRKAIAWRFSIACLVAFVLLVQFNACSLDRIRNSNKKVTAKVIPRGVVSNALQEEKKAQDFPRKNWINVLNRASLRRGAEVGVWKGEFSELVLKGCPSITEYMLVDPWAHLDDWNKPFNVEQKEFDSIYDLAMIRTKNHPQHGSKVTVLRGRSRQVAPRVEDESLDFVYIDGDHTLKGAVIDMTLWYPKVKVGGLVFGDDFAEEETEKTQDTPTMVKPVVLAFAEAVGATVFDMGGRQWGFEKPAPPLASD